MGERTQNDYFLTFFRKKEQKKNRMEKKERGRSGRVAGRRGRALTSMSVSGLVKHEHGVINLKDTRAAAGLASSLSAKGLTSPAKSNSSSQL